MDKNKKGLGTNSKVVPLPVIQSQQRFSSWNTSQTQSEKNDNLNELDEILAEHFSPEPSKSEQKNNLDSLDFEDSDDINNIIEKYESMLG